MSIKDLNRAFRNEISKIKEKQENNDVINDTSSNNQVLMASDSLEYMEGGKFKFNVSNYEEDNKMEVEK